TTTTRYAAAARHRHLRGIHHLLPRRPGGRDAHAAGRCARRRPLRRRHAGSGRGGDDARDRSGVPGAPGPGACGHVNITLVPMTWDDAVLAGWLALGGGAGAALRYVLDVAVSSRWRRPFPLATFLINVSGSLALGLLVGWFYAGSAGPGWSLAVSVIGTGLLGGYTT